MILRHTQKLLNIGVICRKVPPKTASETYQISVQFMPDLYFAVARIGGLWADRRGGLDFPDDW